MGRIVSLFMYCLQSSSRGSLALALLHSVGRQMTYRIQFLGHVIVYFTGSENSGIYSFCLLYFLVDLTRGARQVAWPMNWLENYVWRAVKKIPIYTENRNVNSVAFSGTWIGMGFVLFSPFLQVSSSFVHIHTVIQYLLYPLLTGFFFHPVCQLVFGKREWISFHFGVFSFGGSCVCVCIYFMCKGYTLYTSYITHVFIFPWWRHVKGKWRKLIILSLAFPCFVKKTWRLFFVFTMEQHEDNYSYFCVFFRKSNNTKLMSEVKKVVLLQKLKDNEKDTPDTFQIYFHVYRKRQWQFNCLSQNNKKDT